MLTSEHFDILAYDQERGIPMMIRGLEPRRLPGKEGPFTLVPPAEVLLDPRHFAHFAARYLFNYGWLRLAKLREAEDSIYIQCLSLLKLELPEGMRPGFFYLAGVLDFETGLAEAEGLRGEDVAGVSRAGEFLDPNDPKYQTVSRYRYTRGELDGPHKMPIVKLALYPDNRDENDATKTDPRVTIFAGCPLAVADGDRRGSGKLLMGEKVKAAQEEFVENGNDSGYQLDYSDNGAFIWKVTIDRLMGVPLKSGCAYNGLRRIGSCVGVIGAHDGQLTLHPWNYYTYNPFIGAAISVWEEEIEFSTSP